MKILNEQNNIGAKPTYLQYLNLMVIITHFTLVHRTILQFCIIRNILFRTFEMVDDYTIGKTTFKFVTLFCEVPALFSIQSKEVTT